MKAEELMVGDLISMGGVIGVVTGIRIHDKETENGVDLITTMIPGHTFPDSNLSSRAYYCYPIPLTPEILENNGFTNYGESWYIPNTEDCIMVGFHMYETTINISKDRVSFSKSIPCEYRSCYSNRNVFVHELQHALRLCGIDKKITI